MLGALRPGGNEGRIPVRVAAGGIGGEGGCECRQRRLVCSVADECRIDRAVGRGVIGNRRLSAEVRRRREEVRRSVALSEACVRVELHLIREIENAVREERIACLRLADRFVRVAPLQRLNDVRGRGRTVGTRRIVLIEQSEAVAGRGAYVVARTDGTCGIPDAAVGVEAQAGIGATTGQHHRRAVRQDTTPRKQRGLRSLARRRRHGVDAVRAEQIQILCADLRIVPPVGVKGTIPLEGAAAVIVLRAHHDVAAAIRDLGAHEGRDPQLVAVAGRRDAVLHVDLQTLEVLLQDEVGHTADGIGAVYRRCTTSDDFDAIDHRRRNAVDVRHHQGVDRRRAVTVDEHQAAVGSEAAQRDRRDADGIDGRRLDVGVTGRGRGGRVEIGELVEIGLDIETRAGLELFRAHRYQWAGRLELGPPDARSGYRDLLQLGHRGIRSSRALLGRKHLTRGRHHCRAKRSSDRNADEIRHAAGLTNRHLFPPDAQTMIYELNP